MTLSVIKVASGGLAVSQAPAPYGYPCVLSTNGFGLAVTVVATGGRPISDATPGGGIFAGIQLSNATFIVGAATSSAIGNLSVVGGSGTYVFSLADTASNKVKVAGTNGVNLQVGTTVATVGSFSCTVSTTGGTPNFAQSFLITVLPIAPSNSGGANLPAISGTPAFNNTLTASTGTWAGNPVPTYTYQWKRAGSPISGETASTHLLGVLDIGSTITVTVTATNSGGSASATSAATATVAGLAPVNSVAPVISGSAVNGQVLTVTSDGTWSGTPTPTYTYQWMRTGTEAAAFLARTSGLDTTHTNAYIALINGLVVDGVWAKLDVLHIYATQDLTTALLNLVSTSYNGTANGSPTFTADRGFTGVESSSTVYIATGFTPSTAPSAKYTLNSAHVSTWIVGGTSGLHLIGANQSGANATFMLLQPGGTSYYVVNQNGLNSVASGPAITGHQIANRTNSTTIEGYRNGSSVMSTSGTSTALPNLALVALGMNSGSVAGSGYQQGLTSIGASLTSIEATAFYNRLRTYMTAVGVP